MSRKIQLSILSVFIAAALVGSVVTFGENMAFATKKSSNEGAQLLDQLSETGQLSECTTDNNTLASCNNVGLSFNAQDGNNAAGQQ
jgi:ABC-type antimicrobial peptide transport system permease subunit